ncbi:Peptide methionine sulfoxide reductase MsrA 2 [Novipirellula aureliae]|uniref:Peptide methionine sulfoxide reductase MsrA n=1 Tax=Novipirellula aureliae TaxID=2527966 RepID=A0A5C6E0Z1_9BACT|nr:peptide-methionine (S)-S-oxide reductase MsrA [Novipirellula aureliae]TWU41321.1 Peptide methionine sulfoxide reductase MsrA 2 [Novipirellula aureliae]
MHLTKTIKNLNGNPGRLRFLAAVVIICLYLLPKAAFADEPQPKADTNTKPDQTVATLAAGCFWCTEAVYERIEGVNDVVSGYTGGPLANPNYTQVLTGRTGHAEAVEVYYDPSVRTYEEILKIFFKTHDPTSLNRQGADVGTQYRSAIFYHNDEQKKIAEATIKKLNESSEFRNRIVTTLEPAEKFYPAEEYHQDYYRRNPYQSYCQRVVRTKVRKTNLIFSDLLKKSQ